MTPWKVSLAFNYLGFSNEFTEGYIATLIDMQLELAEKMPDPVEVDWPLISDYTDEHRHMVAAFRARRVRPACAAACLKAALVTGLTRAFQAQPL